MFRNYTRFTPQTFIEISNRIEPIISKQDTNMRRSLEPGFKLAVTLRYLATGDSYMSLKYAFRCGHNTISLFIPEVCRAIIQVYQQEAFPGVWTEEGWRAVAQGFQERWNMPHCMGALDGKHCSLKKPKNSGSVYYNYKGFFSIPLLALVDAGYKFLWAELGGFGSMSDAQIFLETDLRDALETNDANRPPACPLTEDPEDTVNVPYFIVSDDAFALRDFCLKPYSRKTMDRRQLVFNYRLSRARRVVENAFGIMAHRFRIFLKTVELQPRNYIPVIKAALVLHNIALDRQPIPAHAVDREDERGNITPGSWRDVLVLDEQPQPPRTRADTAGKRTREIMADFFGSPHGMVPWQWEMAHVNPPEQLEHVLAAARQPPAAPSYPAPAASP